MGAATSRHSQSTQIKVASETARQQPLQRYCGITHTRRSRPSFVDSYVPVSIWHQAGFLKLARISGHRCLKFSRGNLSVCICGNSYSGFGTIQEFGLDSITYLHDLLFGHADQVADQPLSMETGEWSTADDNPSIAADLLQEETQAGWIKETVGGEEDWKQMYLVMAPNRSPRLVVYSSISGVTAHTCIPNRMCLPHISDVLSAAPDAPAWKSCVLLTLDVAKAHRRIKIHPDYRTSMFSCPESIVPLSDIDLRCAGMLMRVLHTIVHVRHSMFIYVDDLLATWSRFSTDVCFHDCYHVHVPPCPTQLEENADAVGSSLGSVADINSTLDSDFDQREAGSNLAWLEWDPPSSQASH